MRLLTIISAMMLAATTASAQLCAPSASDKKDCVMTYPLNIGEVSLGGDLRTVVDGELLDDGKALITTIRYTYPVYAGFDSMIESLTMLVKRWRAPKPALIGETPAKEEASIETVSFHPVDPEMHHFAGELVLSKEGWDRIDVTLEAFRVIKKSEYNPKLIKE